MKPRSCGGSTPVSNSMSTYPFGPSLSLCMHGQIHLRNFFVTRHCPVDLSTVDPEELRLMRGGEPTKEDED